MDHEKLRRVFVKKAIILSTAFFLVQVMFFPEWFLPLLHREYGLIQV